MVPAVPAEENSAVSKLGSSTETRTERLLGRLEQVCSGRQHHPDLFYIEAACLRSPRRDVVALIWHDWFTHQSGYLGVIPATEASPIVRAVFRELRAWRRRCELQAAAGGGQ